MTTLIWSQEAVKAPVYELQEKRCLNGIESCA